MIPGEGGFSDANRSVRKSQCWGFCLSFHCAIKQYVSILGSIADVFSITFFYGDSVKLMVALFHQKLPLFTPISRAYYPWIITLVALLFLTAQDCNDVME